MMDRRKLLSLGAALALAGTGAACNTGTTLQSLVDQIITLLKANCSGLLVTAADLVTALSGLPLNQIVPKDVADSICAQFAAAKSNNVKKVPAPAELADRAPTCHLVVVNGHQLPACQP